MTHVSKLILLCAFSPVTNAQEFRLEQVSEINFYPTWNKSPAYIGSSETDTYYLFANSRITLTRDAWMFEVQPEVRAVESTQNLAPRTTQALTQTQRLMSLNRELSSKDKREVVLDIERLNLNYRRGSAQLSVGRKPVSLGVLSIFPVWNKFTRPLMTDDGPLRIYSQDQASFRIQRGEWLAQALDIEERNARESGATRVGEVSWYGDGLEVHVIGGEWWQSGAFGVAAVKDILGTSVRLEEISFAEDGVQAGAGMERAFNEFWSGLIEFMYLESGAGRKADYVTLTPSRFRPLNARSYGFARLEYKPSALWILQLGDLMNLVDSSQLWNAKVIYSAANDLELTGELRLPTGSDDSELSRHVLPTQVLAGVRYNF